MFGSTFEIVKIDSRVVELILTCSIALEQNWSYLQSQF